MTSQLFYDQVASELMSGPPHPGLWARAYALADGDLPKARARYIVLRAQQLEARFIAESEEQQQDKACGTAPGATGSKSAPGRRGWPYLTENECITELTRFGHAVTKAEGSSWLIAKADPADAKRVKSLYELQLLIADLWQSSSESGGA